MYRKGTRKCPKQRNELFKHCVPRTQTKALSITMAQSSDPGGYIRSSQFKMQKPEPDHVYPLVTLVIRTGKMRLHRTCKFRCCRKGESMIFEQQDAIWEGPSHNTMTRLLTTDCRGQAAVARSHDVFREPQVIVSRNVIAVQE